MEIVEVEEISEIPGPKKPPVPETGFRPVVSDERRAPPWIMRRESSSTSLKMETRCVQLFLLRQELVTGTASQN